MRGLAENLGAGGRAAGSPADAEQTLGWRSSATTRGS